MSDPKTVLPYVNKEVSFAYCKQKCTFFLSQGLFSSFDIDAGTKLLLKITAQKLSIPPESRVLDFGCGTGVLGLALKAANPDISVESYDRDALALLFTRLNADKNKLSLSAVKGRIAPAENDGPFHFLFSNIPAKAGEAVHRYLMQTFQASLHPEGTLGIVVVAALGDLFSSLIAEMNGTILHEEHTRGHRAYLIRFPNRINRSFPGEPWPAFLRYSGSFQVGEYQYALSTVYGLPEFDTPAYHTVLAAEMLDKVKSPVKALLCIEPGQGHLVKVCRQHIHFSSARIDLAGRDLLSLLHVQRGCTIHESSQGKMNLYHTVDMDGVEPDGIEGYDAVISHYVPVAGQQNASIWWDNIKKLLQREGNLLIFGKSNDIFKLLQHKEGFTVKKTDKYRGFRSVLLVAQSF